MDMLVGTIHSLNHDVDVPIRNMCGGKKRKKTYKKKRQRNHIMKIVLVGGSNWLGRDLMRKLLSEKKSFHLTWIDNLSSEYSSRHYTWEF